MTSQRLRMRASLVMAGGCLIGAGLLGACGGEGEELADDGLVFETRSEDLVSNPLTPVLDCIDNLGNNKHRAHFGYANASSRQLRVPIGLLNFFVPGPKNQGQPTDFAPGTHRDVFTVTFSSRDGWDRLAWWLAGRRALATKHTPECSVPECALNEECDDDDPCTSDACASGLCSNAPAPAGTTCAHGDVCDGAGACVECLSAAQCDDEQPCTTDLCSSGECVYGAAPSGTTCGHGGSCDGAGTCVPPACAVDLDCDDEDPCTSDACSSGSCDNSPAPAGTACAHANVCDGAGECVECLSAAQCDDEQPCTTDVCSSGECVYGSAPAGTPCGHDGSCDGAGTCSP